MENEYQGKTYAEEWTPNVRIPWCGESKLCAVAKFHSVFGLYCARDVADPVTAVTLDVAAPKGSAPAVSFLWSG